MAGRRIQAIINPERTAKVQYSTSKGAAIAPGEDWQWGVVSYIRYEIRKSSALRGAAGACSGGAGVGTKCDRYKCSPVTPVDAQLVL